MYIIFLKVKEERIDKQYYVTPMQNNPATNESAMKMINIAMGFNPRIIAFKNNLKIEEIRNLRNKIKEL